MAENQDSQLSEVNDKRSENLTNTDNARLNPEKYEGEIANRDISESKNTEKDVRSNKDDNKVENDSRGSNLNDSESISHIKDTGEKEEQDKTDLNGQLADRLNESNLNCDISTDNGASDMSKTGDKEDTELEYFSDQSESGDEYESAEEGEDIHTDSTNLKELEETLTEEEKEERRNTSREMKDEGNQLFKDGSYKSAIRLYSRGLRMCPLKYEKDRSVLYANRGACKVKLEEFEDAIKDCGKALDLNPDYMKVLQRRAELYEKLDKLDEALADYQKILELDPGQHKARAACMKLPDLIKERNEKLKEEMMGKLKELGNMVLRPFGLSTSNFKMQQDPNTGGYSVNFVQNPDNGS